MGASLLMTLASRCRDLRRKSISLLVVLFKKIEIEMFKKRNLRRRVRKLKTIYKRVKNRPLSYDAKAAKYGKTELAC